MDIKQILAQAKEVGHTEVPIGGGNNSEAAEVLGQIFNASPGKFFKSTELSKILNIPLETVKYRFREHISKRGLIEDYQIEIFRFHALSSESFFFKFEFDSYENYKMFALSLRDKPFPTFIGKVLGQHALVSHINLPKKECRKFIESLSTLIRKGLLKRYHYVIQDMFVQWRETIPYEHFEDGGWKYDVDGQIKELVNIIKKNNFVRE